jgi:hypothetical protein
MLAARIGSIQQHPCKAARAEQQLGLLTDTTGPELLLAGSCCADQNRASITHLDQAYSPQAGHACSWLSFRATCQTLGVPISHLALIHVDLDELYCRVLQR